MGNHEHPCDYCGEDMRGLCGVRGCFSLEEAKTCSSFKEQSETYRNRIIEKKESKMGDNS